MTDSNYMIVDLLTGETTSLFIGNKGPQILEMYSFVMAAPKPSRGFNQLAIRLESMIRSAREEGFPDAAGFLEAFQSQSGLDPIGRTPTGLSLPSPTALCIGSPKAIERARQAITHFVVDLADKTVTAYQRYADGLWPFEPTSIENWSDFIRAWTSLDISDLDDLGALAVTEGAHDLSL